MAKKQETQEAVMSTEFIKKCKADIAKYGFNNRDEYPKFLISVKAMKNSRTVMKYPNEEIQAYREEFLKKNEYSIGDSFALDKFKIMSTDESGHSYETGYFVPRAFWDKILSIKTT